MEDHPATRDAIVVAVQEVTHSKLLQTPASTPCNAETPDEASSAPLAFEHITQEEELGPDVGQHKNKNPFVDPHNESSPAIPDQQAQLFINPHDQGSPTVQQGLGHEGRLNQAYVEDANDSETEPTSGDSQPLANLDVWLPAHGSDDLRDQDAHRDGQLLRQAATPLISHQSDTTQYKSPKRKHNFEGSRNPKRMQVEALDATEEEGELGSRSLQFSGSFELQPATDQNDERNGQPNILEAGQGCWLLASADTSLTPLVKVSSVQQMSSMSKSPYKVNPPAEGSSQFTNLTTDLRAKVQMIADTVTLRDAWHFFNYMGTPPSFTTDYSDAGSNLGPDVPLPSSSDQRLRELKNCIIRQEETDKLINITRLVARVSKRVYLAELIGKYIEETAARKAELKKKRMKNLRRLSVNDRFTDLLFPETIKCKGKQLSEKEKSLREKAKQKLEYWIRLGKPLA